MNVVIAGKFDPLHEGHIDHIVRASRLGYLTVITHRDEVISKERECMIPLWARIDVIEGLMLLYQIKGEVMVSLDDDGSCVETLRYLSPDIFAKGGDRTPENMPQREIDVCAEIGCRIVYGVGDLLNSSSKILLSTRTLLR